MIIKPKKLSHFNINNIRIKTFIVLFRNDMNCNELHSAPQLIKLSKGG